jgi:hypothetical protein
MPDVFVADNKAAKKGGKDKKASKKRTSSYNKVKRKNKHHTMKKHSSHPMTSYSKYPEKARFINEDPEEVIILLLRRHPITNLRWILASFFMLVIPAFFSAFPVVEVIPTNYKLIGLMLWYLITFTFAFQNFLGWFFQVNIITDERIIEVDFINLVYREITDANIDQIQDVTVQMGGAVRTFFNYGDVVVQTAAEIPQITLDAVPNPDGVSRVLREQRVEEEIEKIEGRVR